MVEDLNRGLQDFKSSALLKTRGQNLPPIYDQNGWNIIPGFRVAHVHIAHVKNPHPRMWTSTKHRQTTTTHNKTWYWPSFFLFVCLFVWFLTESNACFYLLMELDPVSIHELANITRITRIHCFLSRKNWVHSSGAPAASRASKLRTILNYRNRATCMHSNRRPCNSFFMVDMASEIDHGTYALRQRRRRKPTSRNAHSPADTRNGLLLIKKSLHLWYCVSCIATVSNNTSSLRSATILTHTIAWSHIFFSERKHCYSRNDVRSQLVPFSAIPRSWTWKCAKL